MVPQPQKRPRSSLIRFEAELPNEMWQADITHWRLAGGQDVEILNMIDDHSRLFLASRAFPTAKAADVVDVFRSAIDLHGVPASLLCDNGAVFTATPRGGKVLLQLEMERLGVVAKNSRPYHPQTCGKVERLHQTLKRYLARQAPAKTLAELQAQLDAFVPLLQRDPPPPGAGRAHAPAGLQRPDQGSAGLPGGPETHFRVRHDKVDGAGQGQPAPRLKAPPHRPRSRPQGQADQAARRRSRHPRPRRPDGGADPSADPRSEPRLPADRRGLRCLRCPATSVSDVATHHSQSPEPFGPATLTSSIGI